MSLDIKISSGRIINGTSNPSVKAEIGIRDEKIVEVKRKITENAKKSIDAKGLVVSPGFIDMHTHTDYSIQFNSKADSFIHQGITTSVMGMCGTGFAPVTDEKIEDFRRIINTYAPEGMEFEVNWRTYKDYINVLKRVRCPINLACVVGYENIRVAGGAGYENRDPTPEEMSVMKHHLAEAMEAGAFGMSTGLIIPPQIFAKKEEFVELLKVVAKYGGLYFSHIRGAGENLIPAVKEFIELVEKSGCVGGQIAHYKISGIKYWGTARESLKLIEEANARGISVTFDQYPYIRGMSNLITTLPPWAHEGGIEKSVQFVKNEDTREKIKQDIVNGLPNWENWIRSVGFDRLYLAMAKTDKWKPFLTKSISEITKLKGYADEWVTYFEILIDEQQYLEITIEGMCEDDIETIMINRFHMVGSDAAAIPKIKELGTVHPRFYGTFPRVLGRYVREKKVLKLEHAIRKMTSFPAQRLGLRDRGLIVKGAYADIVIFDPDTIIDKATFSEPHQYPEGINYVLVNGKVVINNTKRTKKRPGKVLLHKSA